MKKKLSLIMAMFLVFTMLATLAACGQNQTTPPTEQQTVQAAEATEAGEAAETTAAEDSADEETTAAT
ncbi:MAG: hypothetical protein FWH01_12560, partial [Oscillospiraceae bacterium]|nr:hypothetical protein [Oscillospiraceae bacterium]